MKWAEHKIALRYANSLFMLSREQGALEEVHQDMLLVATVCKASRDLRNMLDSPIVKHDRKKNILEAVFRRKLHKLTFAMIALITAKHREPLIPAIALEFHVLYNEFNRIQKANIITPVLLDEKLCNAVKTIVRKYSRKEVVELEEQIDRELIGGFILKIDDKQIDTSLSNRLKSLKMIFTESA